MDLHPGELVVFEGHPAKRASLSFYVPFGLLAIVVAVVVAVAVSVPVGILVFVVLAALLWVVGHVKRTATDYAVTTQRLYIRRGILSKRVQQTRIGRVQNVNTNQSLLERLLRVGTVEFETAGTDESDFRFAGISDPAGVVAAVDRAQREAENAAPQSPII
jgi:uncharacterized membrane protein YdbT with pleckstrin-like domain